MRSFVQPKKTQVVFAGTVIPFFKRRGQRFSKSLCPHTSKFHNEKFVHAATITLQTDHPLKEFVIFQNMI